MMRLLMMLACLSLLVSCGGRKPPRPEWSEDPTLVQLMMWMEGDFDNSASLKDPGRSGVEQHPAVVVHARRVPTIPMAVYVEEALAESPDQPYRQCVYFLHKDGKSYVATAHSILDAAKYVNAHRDPSMLSDLSVEGLAHSAGCNLSMKWDGERYTGGTRGKGCASSRGGAAYETSEMEVYEGGFVWWERGFDAAGAQVWGPGKLGLQFARIQQGADR